MQQLNLFRTTSKIVSLSQSGMVAAARVLFDEMPERDSVAWNAMITSYSRWGLPQEALPLFSDLRSSSVKPDGFTFTAVLSACASIGVRIYGAQLHGLIVTVGYQSSLPVSNALIDMYGKCLCPCDAKKVFNEMRLQNEVSWCSMLQAYAMSGHLIDARSLFDAMPSRNDIAWNTMLAGYSRSCETGLSMKLFKQMLHNAFKGDWWSLSSLMNVCAKSREPRCGSSVHAYVIKSGWNSAAEVNNSVLGFYVESGRLLDAVKVFQSITSRTLISWNILIDAYIGMGDSHNALALFQEAPEKNVVSWTAMIGGYARNGHGEQGLNFFINMLRSLLRPDKFAFGAALLACANLAFLGHGRMIHGCIVHCGFPSHVYVCNSLVNMYSKCGDVGGASQAFREIRSKDAVSWNEMIFGFAVHGQAESALKLFDEMLESGVKPDKVTFIGLLMACSHSGQIEKGRALIDSMKAVHGLQCEEDHIACMVDMLGRGGYIEVAAKLIKDYSKITSKVSSISALLGACAMKGDAMLGQHVGKHLLTTEPSNEMSYMLLSNLHSAVGQWEEAATVRRAMVMKGVKKKPGCSWIEIGNLVMVFVAGDVTNPLMGVVCDMLCLLDCEMRYQIFFGFGGVS